MMMTEAESKPDSRAVSADLHREIEAFLYREARLLDTERQREWLEHMVDKAIEYKVWSHQLRFRKDKRSSGPTDVYMYDDDYRSLDVRVAQFETGLQWRVDPPERVRHIVSNVEAFEGEAKGTYQVFSNCLVIRNRRVYEESTFVYGREDTLRRAGDGRLLLLRRHVDYDQRFVPGRNLLFFL